MTAKCNEVTSQGIKQIKSNAVVKYAAYQTPANYVRLRCNTDLNMPPSNWLSNSVDSYGLQHVLSQSTGFSSFRMAHMFPDCVGEVDVVSDAENIKTLLKLPYSKGHVSMMVHRIENTLLLDDFDIYKHLLRTAESEWEWLRKFFYEHVRKYLSEKDKHIYLQNKSRQALQQKSLVSKFLYHSLVAENEREASNDNENLTSCIDINDEDHQNLSRPRGPALPEPSEDEEVPDSNSNHNYNRNVVWTFEDIQMLIGTDMPIFGGTTHPCISLRLRDMNRPINVLTGIDYWLDNLMSNVPEVVMCYHLNGIVQKYELVKTEDLPYLDNSKFSPKVIRDVAQNILSFLKSNATKAGHTYWLFKGKDDDVVKLYDLTSLCSDFLCEKDQNPFTVPVAMLLYRVARNMKHSSDRRRPGTIRKLLKNCINLLPLEKYPQIVTSSHYMLSDLYVPANTNPATPGLDQMETEEEVDDNLYDDDFTPSGNNGNDVNAATKILKLNNNVVENKHLDYKVPPPISGSLEERCEIALQHVGAGLNCLQFFPTADKEALDLQEKEKRLHEEQNINMAKPNEAIPMPYKDFKNSQKKKKKERNVSKKLQKKEDVALPTALLLRNKGEAIPTWQEPDPNDNSTWNAHLKTLLYEKAALVYAILAEHYYIILQYGTSLKNIGLLVRCQELLKELKTSSAVQESCFLGRAGDCCFMISKNWPKLEEYDSQYQHFNTEDLRIIEQIEKDEELFNIKHLALNIKDVKLSEVGSLEEMMLASSKFYEKALGLELESEQERHNLYRRLGNIQNELGMLYLQQANGNTTSFQELYQKALKYLESGIQSFETVKDTVNLALLHSNIGHLMRLAAHYHSPEALTKRELTAKEKHYYKKSFSSYQKALQVLVSRENNPAIWDTVHWELSGALFSMAQCLQDYPSATENPAVMEREVVEMFQKALQFCDLETQTPKQPLYQFRAAAIHQRLASLYHHSYRSGNFGDNNRKKNIVHLAKTHYEKAAKLFLTLEQPVEFLTSQMESVALHEHLADSSSNAVAKLKYYQQVLSIIVGSKRIFNVLKSRCKSPESSFINKKNNLQTSEQQQQEYMVSQEESSPYTEIFQLLKLMKQRLQNVLRLLTKLCISKPPVNKECDKLAGIYKTAYSLTLKITDKVDSYQLVKILGNTLNGIENLLPKIE